MSAFAPERLTLAALRAAGMPVLHERDPLVWVAWMKAKFEEESGRTLYPDQTEMLLIETVAEVLALQGSASHEASRANFTVFNEGVHLDAKAAENSVARLLAQPAACAVRATLAAPLDRDVIVPAGTRVGAVPAFALDADLLLDAGETSAEGTATATETGERSNGFAPGSLISRLGSIATGLSLSNTSVTAGGAEREDDERLRQSAVDGKDRLGRKGHWRGYALAVRRVSPAITDVAVDRPAPGRIDLVVHTAAGPASPELLERVTDAIPPDEEGPHGDDILARPSIEDTRDVLLRVRRRTDGTAASDADIRAAVEEAFRRLRRPQGSGDRRTRFAFETGPLGAELAPAAITSAVIALPGMIDCEAPGLAFAHLPFDTVPVLGALTIDYLGEDA